MVLSGASLIDLASRAPSRARPRGRVLAKVEDKEFNSLIWVGMDKRSRKAVSKGVKPHSANYAPVGRSYGCSALKPQDLKNLVELGWDQRVMTFVWVPQCEYF